jgi:hypothetical protein
MIVIYKTSATPGVYSGLLPEPCRRGVHLQAAHTPEFFHRIHLNERGMVFRGGGRDAPVQKIVRVFGDKNRPHAALLKLAQQLLRADDALFGNP